MKKKENKIYCEFCDKYQNYHIVDKEFCNCLKGKKYKYIGKAALCNECNNELYLGEINDYNLKALYNEYRIYNRILSLENIKDIPKKYNIGIRPLSKLLGWGELTYTRYIDGDMPSKEYSQVLIELFNNPRKYNDLLENNKAKISDIAYRKSKEEVNKLLNINTHKLFDVSEYIVYKCENDITPLALQKLLYYIQGFSYAINSEFMFIDDCEAWIHGPVYNDVYQHYKKFKYEPINVDALIEKIELSKKELLIIDGVLESFGKYSPKLLKEFTHQEDPWKKTRIGLLDNEPSNKKIDKCLIGEYFVKVVKKFDINKAKEISKYSNALYLKINKTNIY